MQKDLLFVFSTLVVRHNRVLISIEVKINFTFSTRSYNINPKNKKKKTKKTKTKEFILIVSVVPRVNDALSCSLQTCPLNFPKEEISLQEEYHCTRFFQQFLTPFIQGRSLNDHTVSRFTDSKMERR